MKTVILSMAAVSALAMAAPAAAQYANGGYQQNGTYQQNGGYPNQGNGNGQYQNGQNQNGQYQNGQNGYGANGNISARIAQLQTRIQAGVQSGAINRQEAYPLRQQLRQLIQLDRQYSANGLTGQERADLQQRFRTLRQQVRAADGGANGQYDQSDRDTGYGQNGQNGEYGQNGQNGGYEQPAQRGGLGGLVDRVLGNGGLRVGQRASGNLGGVPYEYQNQYRDTNAFYFRSDSRQIYQIDARTQTVVRVYPMSR